MAKQPTPDSAQNTSVGNQSGRTARLRPGLMARLPKWSRRTKITVLIVVLLVSAHGVALLVWLPRYLAPDPNLRFNLSTALAALDRHSLAEAQHAAVNLQQQRSLDPSVRGGPPFIFGAVAAEEAELAPPSARRAAYLSAAKFLEEARQRGFPATRQAQGLFLLGKCLYLAGQFAASRTPLEEAVRADPKFAHLTNDMLASAYSQALIPTLRKPANSANGAWPTNRCRRRIASTLSCSMRKSSTS